MIWNYLVSTYITGQIDCKTIYSIGPRLKAFSDWLLQVIASGNLESMIPAAAREYAPFVEELWRDGAFQATYNRRNELELLPRVATYFLERVKHASCPCLLLLFLQFLEYVVFPPFPFLSLFFFLCVCSNSNSKHQVCYWLWPFCLALHSWHMCVKIMMGR